MKSIIHLSEKVPNRDRRFGAAPEYFPVMIKTGPRVTPALFTPAQISDAIARAEANPEDMPAPARPWWLRALAWLVAR